MAAPGRCAYKFIALQSKLLNGKPSGPSEAVGATTLVVRHFLPGRLGRPDANPGCTSERPIQGLALRRAPTGACSNE